MSIPPTSRSRHKILPFLALAVITACQSLSPSPTPIPRTPEPTQRPVAASQDILAPCRPDLQAAAMHPDEIPDWKALGLAACYELQLDILDQGAFSGRGAVHFRNLTGQTLDDIVFRLYPNAQVIYGGKLTVTEALRDGAEVEPEVFLTDQTALRLPLEPALPPDGTTVLEFAFNGQTPQDFGGLPDVYGIYNYSTDTEVLALTNWFPILAVWQKGAWDTRVVSGVGDAVVSESALYMVTVSHPRDWEVTGTGTPLDTNGQNERAETVFVSGPARDFTLLASPNWLLREQEVNGIAVRHWGLPGGEGRWEEALQATVDSLEIFNDRFGLYAYSELDVIAAPMMNASGVEYPGMFIIRDRLYQPDSSARPFWLGVVAAHETAHQWWYAIVGNDVLESPWQDEGLASFSQFLFQELHQPEWYEGTVEFYNQTVDNLDSQPGDHSLAQPAEAFADRRSAYGPVIYSQGAIFFMDLKEEIGQEAFYEALQYYYSSNRYALAPPEALLNAFEESCACQLDSFYAAFGLAP